LNFGDEKHEKYENLRDVIIPREALHVDGASRGTSKALNFRLFSCFSSPKNLARR